MKPTARPSTPPKRCCTPWASNNSDSSKAIFWRLRPPAKSSAARRTSSAQAQRGFDAVIANPPYVRTQVLGARRAGLLAAQFGLTGRVDLYHAFARAMADVLKPGGVLGLLVSNRFLTVKSGAALRAMLRTQFALQAIYDLGDTKLFTAAVLPVIVVAKKKTPVGSGPLPLRSRLSGSIDGSGCGPRHRFRLDAAPAAERGAPRRSRRCQSVLAALGDGRTAGLVQRRQDYFASNAAFCPIARPMRSGRYPTADSDSWLKVVQRHVGPTFDDVGRVRVGIKTTADEVFIRDDWQCCRSIGVPSANCSGRCCGISGPPVGWLASNGKPCSIPTSSHGGRRQAIDLAVFPRASRYLESHRQRLSRRQYVIDSGRQWYEIWVPHNPKEWSLPKIVFPDIAAEPRFFLDRSGAMVNGECYWITLRPGAAGRLAAADVGRGQFLVHRPLLRHRVPQSAVCRPPAIHDPVRQAISAARHRESIRSRCDCAGASIGCSTNHP